MNFKRILILILFSLVAKTGFTQCSGTGNPCVGNTYSYTYSGSSTKVSWTLSSGGTINGSPLLKTISVTWNQTGGPYTVYCHDLINGNDCSVTVNVLAPAVGGSVSANISNVCPGGSATLTLSGQSGTIVRWEASTDGVNWTSINNGGIATYNATNLQTTTSYRAVLSACGSQPTSSPATVSVYSGITSAGSISGSSTICYGSAPASLQETAAPASSGGTTFQWQSRVNSGAWTDISGATSSTYAPGALYQTTDFQRLVKWNCNSAQTAASNFVTVTVNATSQGGTLSSTNGTSFCGNGTINLSLLGYVGNVVGWYYQYNDGGGWSGWNQFSTSNSSTNSYTVANNGSADRSYQFLAQVQSGVCSIVNSAVVSVTDYRTTAAGTLAVNQSTLCSSGTVTLSVSGNVGGITRYMMQSSDNGGAWSGWSAISNTPSLSAPAGVNRTYQFQSFAQNGNCAEAGSNIVSTTVYASTTTGTFAASPTSLCSSGSVSVSASSLFSSSTQWQYRYSDNGGPYSGWSNFSTANTSPQTLSVSSTTVDRVYQVQVIAQNGVCSAVTSAPSSITVNSNYTGTLSTSLIEAYGVSTGSFSVSGYAGAFQKWQQSTNGGATWADAAGVNTSPTYQYTNVTTSTKYRALINNGTCGSIYSPVMTLTIYIAPSIQMVGTSVPSIALGDTITFQSGTAYYNYQWIKNNSDIAGATSSSYKTIEPGQYQLRVKANATAPLMTTGNFVIYALGYQPDANNNTLVVTTIRKAGVKESTNLYTSLQPTDYAQQITYSDPLGRPTQQVILGQSPKQHDVVQPLFYDTLKATSYLPYVSSARDGLKKANALTGPNSAYTTSEQYSFYNQSATAKIAVDAAPYVQTVLENSPTNRVLQAGSAGTDWQPGAHTTKREFHSNAANDVRTWTLSGPSGYYAANTLGVVKNTDENGHNVFAYADNLGRTVLKRVQIDTTIEGTRVTYLETYYVYDTRGNLALQVPPKAVQKLNTGTAWTTAFRDQWCFVYTYDGKNRVVTKQSPGTAVQYVAYDPLGRLALTQDGNLRSLGKWAFVKYDFKGRAVISGLYTNNGTLATVQSLLNGLYTGTNPYYEERGTILHGYTNQSFPTDASATEVLSVNYYDNYDFDFDINHTPDYSYIAQGLTGEGTQGNSFDLPTASKKLVLGTSTWLYSYVFYDRFGRAIQTQSNNHLSAAIDNLTTVVYDFEGKVLQTKTYHNAGGTNQTTVIQKNNYDAAGRLIKVYHNINGAAADQLVAQYEYNELGQVVDKKLHNTSGASFLQSVDYRYNIQGRLLSINNAQLSVDNSNDDANDYFGMELLYNNVDAGIGNTANYNGNISAVKWKNGGVASGLADQRSFVYAYDKSDKLLTTAFQAHNGTAWTKEAGTLNETLGYDANGNILTLNRSQNQRGLSGTTVTSTPQTIDNLTYTYASSNQLSKVEDSGTTTGFNNGATNTTEYTYDTNGSLTKDDNKGISSITYNALGKAQQINFTNGNTVVYTYDAAGNKLTMTSTVSGVPTTTNYVGGFVYNTSGSTSTLNFFSSPEGRVVKNGSNFEYQYSITDHQGNTRVVFTSAAQTAQATTATFETANQTTEATQFSNYGHISATANHTPGGSNSQYLNGGYAGMIGVAKSYKVYPGDQLKIEAYGSYNTPSGTTSSLANFAGALLTAFALPTPLQGETGTASSAINTWGGIEAGGWGDGTNDNTDPKAFVNIVLFDKNYKFLDVAYAQLKGTSLYYLSQTYTVKEAGYAYLYVSNEQTNQTDVYFDDVKMTYTPSNIIQSNEYYAHSMPTANSWTRDNSTNNFLGNGGTELNNTSALYDLQYRNYDAVLGRFHQVDPMTDRFSSHSPYNFAFNNPVLLNDPLGDYPPSVTFEYTVYSDAKIGGFREGTLERWAANEEQRDRDRMNRNTTVEELDAAYITFQDGSSMVWLNQGNFNLSTVYDYVTPGDNKSAMAQLDPSQWNPLTDPEVLTQGDVFGFGREDLANSYYTKRGDYVRMKDLLGEFLSGTGPERSLFYGSHPLTQGMMNSAVVDRAKAFYAANYPDGGDMVRAHFDFFATDIPFVGSDIEQFVGSARMSIYQRDGLSIFVLDNTTGRYSGSFDTTPDIPRVPGETTPMGNIYQRFIWIEGH